MMRFFCQSGICLCLVIILFGCKGNSGTLNQEEIIDSVFITDTLISENIPAPVRRKIAKKEMPFDTVWIRSFSALKWSDTLYGKNFEAIVEAWIDTNDYIIDTLRSNVNTSLVIGFNHYYTLHFLRENKHWFSINFNKKQDLHQMLYGTDLWLHSNLDIIHNVIYNEKYESFIIELSIKTGDLFDNMFYIVTGTKDQIQYVGTIRSWGGGDPDGNPFLTDDGRMYVTCEEIYNFVSHTSMNLAEYATMSLLLSGKSSTSPYDQLHGLRYLSNNNFLVVFNRFHNKPKYNALILNTDSLVVERFGYFGLIEDIDAILLFEKLDELNQAFLLDTEREVLISIKTDSTPEITETGLYEMVRVQDNNLVTENYYFLNFGFYGSYEFYISPADTFIYYKADPFE